MKSKENLENSTKQQRRKTTNKDLPLKIRQKSKNTWNHRDLPRTPDLVQRETPSNF